MPLRRCVVLQVNHTLLHNGSSEVLCVVEQGQDGERGGVTRHHRLHRVRRPMKATRASSFLYEPGTMILIITHSFDKAPRRLSGLGGLLNSEYLAERF